MKVGNAEVQLVLDKRKFMTALTMVKAKVKAFAMKAQMQMHKLGAVISGVAAKFKLLLVAGIAAAGIAIWKAVTIFAKFESQMASVGTMLDETSKKYLPSYAAGIRGLSIEIGESTETLSKGLYNILSATIPANQAMKVLELAAKGAAGGMTTTDVAVTALTKSMLIYKELAPEKIMDTLAAAVERGYFTFEQLAGAMPGVLQLGRASNVGFGELSGTMAFLSKRFATVNEAGTALEGLLKAIKIPTGRYKDALVAMGIVADDVSEKISEKGLQGGLKWLIDKAESVGLSVDKMFRRKEAMLAMLAMKMGLEDWRVDIDKVSDSAGTMERKYKEMQETLTFQTNRLKKGFTDAFRVAGAKLAPVMKEIVDRLIKKLPEIINFASKVGTELAGWFKWMMASAKSGALGFIFKLLGYIYDKVKNVVSNFKALGIFLKYEFQIAATKAMLAIANLLLKIPVVGKLLEKDLTANIAEMKTGISALRDKEIEKLGQVKTKSEEFNAFFQESEESKKLLAGETLDAIAAKEKEGGEKRKQLLSEMKFEFADYMTYLRAVKKDEFEKDQEKLTKTLTLYQKYLLKMFKQEKTTMDYIMEIHNAVFTALSAGFENAFMNIGKKSYQFKDFLGAIWESIYKSFAQMVSKMIAKWLTFKALKTGLGFLGGFLGFQKGIERVPFDMMAMVHKGEKIIPANRNQPQNYDMGGITLNLSVGSMSSEDVEPIANQLVEAIKNKLPGAMGLSKQIYNAGSELAGEAV